MREIVVSVLARGLSASPVNYVLLYVRPAKSMQE